MLATCAFGVGHRASTQGPRLAGRTRYSRSQLRLSRSQAATFSLPAMKAMVPNTAPCFEMPLTCASSVPSRARARPRLATTHPGAVTPSVEQPRSATRSGRQRYRRRMLEVRLLGPLEVDVNGTPTSVAAPMQRALLAALALARAYTLTRDQIVEALWNDPPAKSVNTVQQYVSALRARIGRDHLSTTDSGYRLDVATGSVDADRLTDLVTQARGRGRTGDLGGCRRACAAALTMQRGEPLAGLPDVPFVGRARTTLCQAFAEAHLLAARTDLDLGDAASAVSALEDLAAQEPLDELVARELMRALATAGRQVAALKVFETMRSRLADQLGIDPGAQLQAAHLAVLRQDPSFAGPVAARGALAPVPVPANAMVGREREIDDLEQMLKIPATRLVTVTGPGGAGKTRLATEVARRAMKEREVAFVALAAVREPSQVLATVAAALGLSQRPGAPVDIVDQIARATAGRDLLVVLDNLEQLLPAPRDLFQLTAAAEGVQFLATSREALRVSAERRYPLGPLVVSSDGALSPAVELFSERAQAVDPRYRSEDYVEEVAEICRRLDGLPLAIELAAARTNLLSPPDLLWHLDQRLTVLVGGARDAPDRHGSLRACLSWSVDLLTDEERAVLGAASVFVGGMHLPALEAVCSVTGVSMAPLDVVDSLEAKSLLRLHRESGRLLLLEVVREYASELLEASGGSATARDAHATYYHRVMGADARFRMWPPRTAHDLRVVQAELGNLRAALVEVHARGDGPRAADLLVAAWPAWYHHGHLAEPEAHAENLLRRDDIPGPRRADLHCIRGTSRQARGATRDALRDSETALKLLTTHPDAVLESLTRAARVFMLDSLPGAAERIPAELQALADATARSDDPELEVFVLAVEGLFADPVNLAHADDWLAVIRQQHNQTLEAWLLANLSDAALATENPEMWRRGRDWGLAGHELSIKLETWSVAGSCLNNAATAALLLGDDATQVIEDLRVALVTARNVAAADLEVELLLRLAAAFAASGQVVPASALVAAWRELSASCDIDASTANTLVYEKYLADVDETWSDWRYPLEVAVQVALGEVPPPT